MYLMLQYFFIGIGIFHSIFSSASLAAMPNDVMLPLQDLAEEGSRSYYANDWSAAVDLFEKALIKCRMRRYVESTCMVKCKDSTISSEIDMDFSEFDDLYHFGNIVAQANCLKLCKEEHVYRSVSDDLPEKDILEDFDRRKPYNFLQYAYYQIGKVKKASQAAQTYFNANLDDEQAFDNLHFYKSMELTNETFFSDLEAPKFHIIFEEAVKHYDEKNYKEATFQFERVLVEFFNAFDECRSLCYQTVEHTDFYRLYKSTASHLLNMLKCSLQCENKLSPVISGEKLSNFLSSVYSYLQFAYFSMGKVKLAVPAAASAFLLNPADENARYNMGYYDNIEDEYHLTRSVDYQPRQDAVAFHEQKEMIRKLLLTGHSELIENDEAEVIENEEESLVSHLTNEVSAVLNEALAEAMGSL